jgi:SAM-dependent methyltransferase
MLPIGRLQVGSRLPHTGRVANPWDADAPFDYSAVWPASGPIVESMCRKLTGDPYKGWHQYAIDRYVQPAFGNGDARCLILGSSEGTVERLLCAAGFSGEIVASDIAANALARAKQQADGLGYRNIRHVQADLNTDSFDGRFSFIIAEGVLHHVREIARCLRMLGDRLADDGVLIAAEFVGPVRFQLPTVQVAWINAMLGMLPAGLRFIDTAEPLLPATPEQHAENLYQPPTLEHMLAFDPSEAVIGPLLKQLMPQHFDVIEEVGMGGTITTYPQGLLDFARTNEAAYRPFMDAAIALEDALIKTRILSSDYVLYVARKLTER